MQSKTCKKCGIEKDVNLFYDNDRMKNGKSNVCKECAIERAKINNNYVRNGRTTGRQVIKTPKAQVRYRLDEWDAMFDRSGGMCEVCEEIIPEKYLESAHVIPETKRNLKYFGFWFINNRENMKAAHKVSSGLPCNAGAMIGEYTPDYWIHINKVVDAMRIDDSIPEHVVVEPGTRQEWRIKHES